MRKTNQKHNEKGALIIEIIAVVALLGVMGPMLFKQVKNRNEEVDNIAIASEIRTVKEAFSAYIMSERAALLNRCQDAGEIDIASSELEYYLPMGNNAVDSYNLKLNCEDGILQGLISPLPEAMPETLKLKRAARIANLIGADGGICQDNQINGVAGGWTIEETTGGDLCPQEPWPVATTGMDTFTPEVTYEDYSASMVTLPNDLALGKLHAWQYFSVGGGEKGCYEIRHNQTGSYSEAHGFTAQDDIIKGAKECDPVFWVGHASDAADGGVGGGHVYVKNNLIVGQKNNKQAIALFSEGSTSDEADKNRIEVYDPTGTKRIIINGKGEMMAQSSDGKTRVKIDGSEKGKIVVGNEDDSTDNETLTLTHQMLKSNKDAKHVSESYQVDPAGISVMNDIKVDSRGGGNLSDLLPNYITKEVVTFNTRLCNSAKCKIPVPSCPNQHAPAIIVIPTSWTTQPVVSVYDVGSKLKLSENKSDIVLKNSANDTTNAQGALYLYIDTKYDATNHPAGIEAFKKENKNTSKQNWEIHFTNHIGNSRADVKGIAQTYCVFDKSMTKPDIETPR